MLSRQRKWQLKQRELGNCTQCGNTRDGTDKNKCTKCLSLIHGFNHNQAVEDLIKELEKFDYKVSIKDLG